MKTAIIAIVLAALPVAAQADFLQDLQMQQYMNEMQAQQQIQQMQQMQQQMQMQQMQRRNPRICLSVGGAPMPCY